MSEYWNIKEITPGHIKLVSPPCYEGTWQASVRFDGCVHLRNFTEDETDSDYIHICHLSQFIERLEELREIAKERRPEKGWYWEGD